MNYYNSIGSYCYSSDSPGTPGDYCGIERSIYVPDLLAYKDAIFANNTNDLTDIGKSYVNIIKYTNGQASVSVYVDGDCCNIPCRTEQHAKQVVAALQGKYL